MDNEIIDQVKNFTKNLKTLTDELRVQMVLGKAEARDILEQERKNFSQYINRQKIEINKNVEMSNNIREQFLKTVENLENKLLNTVPTASNDYDQYKKEILKNVYQLEEEVKKNYSILTPDMLKNIDSFKNKMDAFRVNLALHDKDDPKKVDRIRNEFSEKLKQVGNLLGERENAQSKLDSFTEDISVSYKILRKAISDLSNKK